MQQLSTLFLRLVIIGLGLVILLFSIFLVPQVIIEAPKYYPASLYLPAFIGVYGAVVPFYFALYQGYILLNLIDKNKAFSTKAVNALGNIKYAAIAVSLLFAASLPLFFAVADDDDAPGLLVIGLGLAGMPFVIGVFAAVMQRLLNNAVDIKSENDLTV